VDEIISRLRNDFEVVFEDGSGAMKVHRGKRHKFVGMSLDYSYPGARLHIPAGILQIPVFSVPIACF